MNKVSIYTSAILISLIFGYSSQASVLNIELSKKPSANLQTVNVSKSSQSNMIFSVNLSKNNSNDFMRNGFYQLAAENVDLAYSNFQSAYEYAREDYDKFNYAKMMVSVGFYSLANTALSEISDNAVWNNQIQSIKKIYFPQQVSKNNLKNKDEAELTSLLNKITSNDISISNLMDAKKKLAKSDYSSYVLAKGYLSLKKYDDANAQLVFAIKSNPTNLNYRLDFAKSLAAQKKYSLALAQIDYIFSKKFHDDGFKKEVRKEQYLIKSKNSDAFDSKYFLAKYHALNGDYESSIIILNKLIAIYPKSYRAYSLLGDVKYSIDDYNSANKNYDKALLYNPKDPSALRGKGNLYYVWKKYRQALSYYQKALNVAPKSVDNIISVANTYNKLNQQSFALDYYQKALVMDELNSSANYQLGLIYKDADKNDIAANYFKKALSVDSSNKQIIKALSEIEK